MFGYYSIKLNIVFFLIELQIEITSWAIVSLAGGGLSKVEEEDRQGEKEKKRLSHPQKNQSGMN